MDVLRLVSFQGSDKVCRLVSDCGACVLLFVYIWSSRKCDPVPLNSWPIGAQSTAVKRNDCCSMERLFVWLQFHNVEHIQESGIRVSTFSPNSWQESKGFPKISQPSFNSRKSKTCTLFMVCDCTMSIIYTYCQLSDVKASVPDLFYVSCNVYTVKMHRRPHIESAEKYFYYFY